MQDFASPILFERIADGNGYVNLVEPCTTFGDIRLEVGCIYLKLQEPCGGKSRNFSVSVEELIIPGGSQTLDAYADFILPDSSDGVIPAHNPVTVLDCHPCVPGYDTGCSSPQAGHPPPSPKVLGAHFKVTASIWPYKSGEKVKGYIYVEIKNP